MDKRMYVAGAALAALVFYVWSVSGRPHGVAVDTRAVEPEYQPWLHWITMRPGGYIHIFPDRIGPATLNNPLQNQDQGGLTVSAGAYAAEEYASA